MTTEPFHARVTSAEPGGEKLRGARVLVVEDHDDTRELLALALEMEGAQVTQADSVQAAMSAIARSEFDVLVSDIGMPGEDGYDLIRRLRASVLPAGAHPIPAVAVTAFDSHDDRMKALAVGFQKHLSKPVDVRSLIDVVAKLAAGDGNRAR